MRIDREEFRNVGQMTMKRRKKKNDNAGHGRNYEDSESTYEARRGVQEFSFKDGGVVASRKSSKKESPSTQWQNNGDLGEDGQLKDGRKGCDSE